jgi:TetR/AcrR family transcriptional repressor of bet genes
MAGRPANTAARRGEIVVALRRVMARHGYERASIAAIAKEAGLAPGLVHYHFESKAEILRELVRGLVDAARRRVDERIAAAHTAEERLDAFVDALLARGEGEDLDAAACWALVGAEAATQSEVRALYAAFVGELWDELTSLLVRACHSEHRSADGAKALAAAIVATIEGYFALGAAAPHVIPVGSAASTTKKIVRGLVRSQPRKERA